MEAANNRIAETECSAGLGSAGTEQQLQDDLDRIEDSLQQAWNGSDASDEGIEPQTLALIDTVKSTPGLQVEPFQDMVKGMRMDVGPGVRYQTFEDLYVYCYRCPCVCPPTLRGDATLCNRPCMSGRVAGTVALMTLPVLGTAQGISSDEAAAPGIALGIALQVVVGGCWRLRVFPWRFSVSESFVRCVWNVAHEHTSGCRGGRPPRPYLPAVRGPAQV